MNGKKIKKNKRSWHAKSTNGRVSCYWFVIAPLINNEDITESEEMKRNKNNGATAAEAAKQSRHLFKGGSWGKREPGHVICDLSTLSKHSASADKSLSGAQVNRGGQYSSVKSQESVVLDRLEIHKDIYIRDKHVYACVFK